MRSWADPPCDPEAQPLTEGFGGGQGPNRSLRPDEAVAYGVVVQAGSSNDDEARDLPFADDALFTRGTEPVGGEMPKLFSRSTVDPASASQLFLMSPESQPAVKT